jgi:hypothetical protein
MSIQKELKMAHERGWRFYWEADDNSLYGLHGLSEKERIATLNENCIADRNALGLIMAQALNGNIMIPKRSHKRRSKSILKRH